MTTFPLHIPGDPEFRLFVAGQPAPQGSKTNYGKGRMVEDNKATKPWREDIRAAIQRYSDGTAYFERDQPLVLHLRFVFRRTTAMPKRATGRGGKPTKPTPPHTKRPDLDKLARAVCDAVTSSGLWYDDNQVTRFGTLEKRYAEIGETPGCWIHIEVDKRGVPS